MLRKMVKLNIYFNFMMIIFVYNVLEQNKVRNGVPTYLCMVKKTCNCGMELIKLFTPIKKEKHRLLLYMQFTSTNLDIPIHLLS